MSHKAGDRAAVPHFRGQRMARSVRPRASSWRRVPVRVGAATCAADRHRLRSPPILPLIEGCCLRGWIVVGLRPCARRRRPNKKISHSIHSCTRLVTEVPVRGRLTANHSIQPRAEARDTRCAVLVTASRSSRSFEVRAGRPVEAAQFADHALGVLASMTVAGTGHARLTPVSHHARAQVYRRGADWRRLRATLIFS